MISKYERHSFSPHAKLALEVTQDMAEVNVEQLQLKQKRSFKNHSLKLVLNQWKS